MTAPRRTWKKRKPPKMRAQPSKSWAAAAQSATRWRLQQRQLWRQLGMDTAIDHVTDFAKIAAYGVMTTPALVVDGKVVSYGKVLKPDEVHLKKVRG